MTDVDPPPPPPSDLPRTKTRLPFEPNPFGSTVQRGAIFLYGVITAALAAVAVYMFARVGHPLFSGYVLAPAIGAIWFGLRLFMMLAKR
jgi:hypothetical protein